MTHRLIALVLFLFGGMLSTLVCIDYLRFLEYSGDTSEQIALAAQSPTPYVVAQVGEWHAEQFQDMKKRIEWTFFATGMLSLLLFLNFVLNMRGVPPSNPTLSNPTKDADSLHQRGKP